jgi:hypothetical protein
LPFVHEDDLSPEEKGTPENEENDMENEKKWMCAQVWANWIIAFFTAALFIVAWQQYRLYRLDQRPWVGATLRSPVLDRPTRKVLGLLWHYMNGGKSPARNIRFNLSLKIGDPLPEKDANLVKAPTVGACSSPQPLPGNDGMLAMPGVDQIMNADATQDILDSGDSIKMNRLGLYFVGCLDYEEVSGGNHRTKVCEYYVPTSELFVSCLRGNDGY